ncbi:MAG: type-F conjugative transfer system protein TraW [Azoarcus sp.]|jgi:conjugal transfer pilus assembly protein TraW|nr:type-F conjugative transfer system protein TraW [Azoarcus sp.]
MKGWKQGCAAFVVLGIAPLAQAIDLGTVGPTYEIAEPHLLRMIEERLHTKAQSGELARIEEEAKRRGIAAVRNPKPVAGLVATTSPRTFYFDPSFALDRNILGAKGELLFAAGTHKNPLEIVSLSKHLLFFDARDKKQVSHAVALIARYRGRIKPILTGGSYLDLMRAWRIPIYYDQHGILTTKFGIRQVPALVSQEGMRLRIDELEIPR